MLTYSERPRSADVCPRSEAQMAGQPLFSFTSLNWRGQPLTSYQVIVELIAATTTRGCLRVMAQHDSRSYPTGARVHRRPARRSVTRARRLELHNLHDRATHKRITDQVVTFQALRRELRTSG